MLKTSSPNSRAWTALTAAWAFAESLVFFIMPDFLLLPLVMRRPDLAKRLLAVAIISSTIGTIALIALYQMQDSATRSLVEGVPFVTQEMFAKVHAKLASGIWQVILQPVSGIPVKVWTVVVLAGQYPVLAFLGLVIIGRGIRMSLVVLLGVGLHRILNRLPTATQLGILILYIVGFMALLKFTAL